MPDPALKGDEAGESEAAEAAPRRDWSGMFRSLVLPLGLLAIIFGGLWYWDARGGGANVEDARYGTVELPAERNATDRSPAAEIGRAAPDFLLETPSGGELRLSDLQGQPVLVNFWATWCPPCRAEMPELVAAYGRYRDDGLVIVAVNLQEADQKVNEFADEFGIEFPIVIDRDGELRAVWRLGGPFGGIPSSYFIDASGIVRSLFYGPMREPALEERLAEILEERAG